MKEFYSNAYASVSQLLEILDRPFSKEELKNDLIGHPDYPSLFALNETLQNYGIQNTPLEISDGSLHQFFAPFIVYYEIDKHVNDFVLVTGIDAQNIKLISKDKKSIKLSHDDFMNRWKKILIRIDSVHPVPRRASNALIKLETKERNIRNVLGVIVLAFLMLFVGKKSYDFQGSTILFTSWLALTFAGSVVSFILLSFDIRSNNELVKQFCSAGKKINCESVLQSSGSKIGPFSWSEIGFSYFIANLLYLLFFANSNSTIIPIAIISLFSAPYIVYSIYYQYKIVKQWCLLCLIVQGLIFLQFILSLAYFNANKVIGLDLNLLTANLLIHAGLFISTLFLWVILRPYLKQSFELEKWKFSYFRLQRNPSLFKAFLNQQPEVPYSIEEIAIRVGRANSTNKILKVCNPFCGPCSRAHTDLESVITECDAELFVIFTSTNSEGDKGGEVSRYFIGMSYYKPEILEEALNWWYESSEKSIVGLSTKFPYKIVDDNRLRAGLQQMRDWVDKADITGTPTIFINNHRLPPLYSVKDIKYLIERGNTQ
jgi:uncharacterized membrane protein